MYLDETGTLQLAVYFIFTGMCKKTLKNIITVEQKQVLKLFKNSKLLLKHHMILWDINIIVFQ